MSQQNQSSNNKFIEMTEFTQSEENELVIQGNVIKNVSLESAKFNNLQMETDCIDEPTVVIRRNGDLIENIEFTCSCGKKKIVKFEYEGE
jgi:hypothetical protein